MMKSWIFHPEDDTDFSPDNFSFDFGGDLGRTKKSAESAAGGWFARREVEAGRLHDSRQDAGATNSLPCPGCKHGRDSEISY